MARYATGTKTTVDASKSEIERTVKRYGAGDFVTGEWGGFAGVMFSMGERRVRFRVRLPDDDPREVRRLWRCLLISIKARLEIVESEIETFDEAFMSHIVMPDGGTVADHVLPRIEAGLSAQSLQAIPFFGESD